MRKRFEIYLNEWIRWEIKMFELCIIFLFRVTIQKYIIAFQNRSFRRQHNQLLVIYRYQVISRMQKNSWMHNQVLHKQRILSPGIQAFEYLCFRCHRMYNWTKHFFSSSVGSSNATASTLSDDSSEAEASTSSAFSWKVKANLSVDHAKEKNKSQQANASSQPNFKLRYVYSFEH